MDFSKGMEGGLGDFYRLVRLGGLWSGAVRQGLVRLGEVWFLFHFQFPLGMVK